MSKTHIKSKLFVECLKFCQKALFLLFVCGTFFSCTKDTVDSGGGGTSSLTERIIPDTSYGTNSYQKMDIYLPAGRTSATKVVIFIHGGGWESGSKSDPEYLQMFNLIKLKWPQAAVASINYRLTSNPAVHHSEIMDDVSSTVNFLVTNKSNFVISDTICMMGASAGGHLAMLYTYKFNANNYVKCVADFFGPAKLNDWTWYNTFNIFINRSMTEVLTNYNGSAWNEPLYASNSPISVASAQSKPTIIFHGTADAIVPLYQSQWLKGQLTTLGVTNEYYEYFDGHGFNYTNTSNAIEKSVAFFKKHLQ